MSLPGETTPAKRRLIVCCDDTWNTPDRYGHTTNVVRLVRSIKSCSAEGVSQIIYYHPGVGTGNIVDHWIGGGTGIGLSENVRSAYAFFVDNYRDGDEIFLFGFSRGAYTARSVAGMLGHVGLLRKHHMENFDEVWDYYRQPEADRKREETTFLANFRDRVPRDQLVIRCIGVWDTVGALGIPGSHFCQSAYQFHDTNLGPGVEYAFQALAIDEERSPYRPAIWHPSDKPRVTQVIEQVWFPGAHSNIGGGYPEHGLSDATFFWMAGKVAPLLDLDLDYLCTQAERHRRYATGQLVNTLTLSWRLTTGRYVRPIGQTDPGTEYIHKSAWTRANGTNGPPLPAPYRDATFKAFLEQHKARMMPLSAFESGILDRIPRTDPELILPRTHRTRTFCDMVVTALGGGPK
jgi:uncharacterized protein (DUF2235 family)